MNLHAQQDAVVELLAELRETLLVLAFASAVIASPSTNPVKARIVATMSQYTAMVWADLLTAENSVIGGEQ
ncbi:MAG: hypothetical protein ACRER8_22175 [Pseudomonas sp.]|uniref:hypothetical protein n=1 Tax=Pseudomonas sp. TaxID=306 RepID=UPI003D6E20A5